MEAIKKGLKTIRNKWHSVLNASQRHNGISLTSVYAFCQNEFLREQNVPFKSLPAYGYYEQIHKLLTIYESRGGVPFTE